MRLNAIRTLRGTYSLWGTQDFLSHPKLVKGEVIDKGDIHYREYTQAELKQVIESNGFELLEASFLAFGSPSNEAALKRLLKSLRLGRSRLFGSGHYIVARST